MNFAKAKEYITNRLVKELPKDYFYHGAHHTFAVVKAASILAAKEKVTKQEYNLILTAAYYHDSGFLFQYKNNELFAANLVSEVLPSFDYSPEETEIVRNMILATQSKVEPNTHLEQIMCDADHDYLGTDNYHEIANTLRKELIKQGTIYEDLEWLKIQHNYLKNKHLYYTKSAILDRKPTKVKMIKELKENIENWELSK